MTVQCFDLSAITPMPWKNGGGTTRELVCWPPHAGLQDFGWRVSVAAIAASGPFSAFPGIDRHIMLLEGDGVHLRSTAAQGSDAIDHPLDRPWQPFAFSGDLALDCTLLGGTSTDFNLMLRRGQWAVAGPGGVELRHGVSQPGQSTAGLCLVLAGTWTWGEQTLAHGQGLWWSEPQTVPLLTPVGDGIGDACLAWVALEPVSEVLIKSAASA